MSINYKGIDYYMEEKNKTSRTENFVKNATFGVVLQLFSLILSFIVRTVFIKCLSNDYLSINGLFSNIINTLSFIELGFGTALIYMLYKPVAEANVEKIKTITKYYKKVFTIIGILMFVIGLSIIPILKYIIKDPPMIDENLNIIYIVFLINTCFSYFFSHKMAVINAHQQNYKIIICNQIAKTVQCIMQILVLVMLRNYMLYLGIQFICTIFNYILINIQANKMYPYLKDKNVIDMEENDKKEIKNKVKSLILYRLEPTLLNNSDNIIISSFLGVSFVGIYSNYYLITNYLYLFINQITNSLETSIGNLNATSDKKNKEETFYKVLFLCFFIYGITCVLLMGLINDFINIWIGKEYLFSNFVVFTIILSIYINGVHFPCYSFRTTSGLFEKTKLVPLIEVIINIVISIILAKYMGVAGVFLGTSLSKLLTFFWTDPKLLYENMFEKNHIKKYYYKYIYYFFVTSLVGTIVFIISKFMPASNYFMIIIKFIVLGIVTLLMFIGLTVKTNEYKDFSIIVKQKLLDNIIKKFRR